MSPRESTIAERRQLRSRLASELPTDADLDAFCIDHCPVVKARFTLGMDRLQKTNLLLELQAFEDLTCWLDEARRTPEARHEAPHIAKRWRWPILVGLVACGVPSWIWLTRTPLIIESDPPGAQVSLVSSGRRLGQTPLSMRESLPDGEHIRLQMPCYADFEIESLSERTAPIRIRLKPLALPPAQTPVGCPIEIPIAP